MPNANQLIPAGDWQTVLHTPTSLVLYNPPSHALTVLPHPFPSATPSPMLGRPAIVDGAHPASAASSDANDSEDEREVEDSLCPYCKRPMAEDTTGYNLSATASSSSQPYAPPTSRYFSILSQANTPISTPQRRLSTSKRGPSHLRSSSPDLSDSAFVDEYEEDAPPKARPKPSKRPRSREAGAQEDVNAGAEGYYSRFFKEEGRLGMGAQGTVFLCQHVLDSQPLGLYAVKKVAVGESHDYLLKVLREVQLLQTLRHENIVTYHHAWIERTRFSSFGPKIQALHILMQFASSGSLEDYILTRTLPPPSPLNDTTSPLDAFHLAELTPEEAKAAIRARRASKGVVTNGSNTARPSKPVGGGERRAVRLLGREEIEGVFGGVVKGLGYLHSHGILHLDLKCSNVLLHQEEGEYVPRALISDFGTSRTVVYGGGLDEARRSGNTGTLEYCSPESLYVDRQGRLKDLGKEGDLWSLGMILYKLLFFKLPYEQIEDFDLLESDIKAYAGFTPTPDLVASFQRRGLPLGYLHILSGLLNLDPRKRPSCDQVLNILQDGIPDDAFHFPDYYDPNEDPSKRLAPFVPRFGASTLSEAANEGEITVEMVEDDGSAPNTSHLRRRSSDGSISSVRTETPARPLSPSFKLAPLPHRHPSSNIPRVLLPPPYPHPLSPLLNRYLPPLLVILKFLSVFCFYAHPPVGLQLAVLMGALVSLPARDDGERWRLRGEAAGLIGHAGIVLLWRWFR